MMNKYQEALDRLSKNDYIIDGKSLYPPIIEYVGKKEDIETLQHFINKYIKIEECGEEFDRVAIINKTAYLCKYLDEREKIYEEQ